MKKCAMCSKTTTKTLEVCQSCDAELAPLFSAAAAEINIPVTEDWDEEARLANRPNFYIPGKPSNRTTNRFLFGCRSCGSRDCNGHGNYIAQVAAHQRQERQ